MNGIAHKKEYEDIKETFEELFTSMQEVIQDGEERIRQAIKTFTDDLHKSYISSQEDAARRAIDNCGASIKSRQDCIDRMKKVNQLLSTFQASAPNIFNLQAEAYPQQSVESNKIDNCNKKRTWSDGLEDTSRYGAALQHKQTTHSQVSINDVAATKEARRK